MAATYDGDAAYATKLWHTGWDTVPVTTHYGNSSCPPQAAETQKEKELCRCFYTNPTDPIDDESMTGDGENESNLKILSTVLIEEPWYRRTLGNNSTILCSQHMKRQSVFYPVIAK